ncbi:speckle-type POZ protein [Trichonephila clavipes]|nr:speckle-type POZ protein [Trichonephila clavipes]
MQKRVAIRQGASENAYLSYLKNLAEDFKSKPDKLSKEKVTLRVGDDTEVVNKAVLCSRSPVFARMLESDMREKQENCVTIDDVKMEAVRGLISYLYSGIVPKTDTYFLYDLYLLANKYDISELGDECRHLLVSNFTVENVCEVLSLSSMCSDDYLKFSAMLFMGSNLRQVVTTLGWKDLMINEPKTALKVADFFHLNPY